MKKQVGAHALNLIVVVSMVLALFVSQPVSAQVPSDVPGPRQTGPKGPFTLTDEAQALTPEEKIDPALREKALAGGADLIQVAIGAAATLDLSQYLVNPLETAPIMGAKTVYGQASAGNLLKIASVAGVIAVKEVRFDNVELPTDPDVRTEVDLEASRARMQALIANEKTYAETNPQDGPGAQGWFDVQDGHKSSAAWKKGFTGEGVTVAVLDDGVDFAHPDLMGTYAVNTDPSSPYYGWPMAFSQLSTLYYASDVVYGTHYIANGAGGSRWSDTSFTTEIDSKGIDGTGHLIDAYQPIGAPVGFNYKVWASSQSGDYKLGSLPEGNLISMFGAAVAVLVVDEYDAGVYDTVYVDLDNDKDFTDEKPAYKQSPEVYRDMDGDGYADISGGLVAWISDGDNTPPVVDWLYELDCDAGACPDSGELVIFAGAMTVGYTHGTQCASNIVAQGVVSDGLSAQPFRVGGMVQGAAPEARVMDFGNFYYSNNDFEDYIVAAFGYDGVPGTGDEAQIASNSYGAFTSMWGVFGEAGRYIALINTYYNPNIVYVFSGGNEGPGYGPQEGSSGPTIIKAGTSTQFGSTNWDSIAGIDQIVYGDPSSFGSKGPNNDGSAGLDVLGNGGRGAGDEGINYYGYNGATSWATWGGTSRSAPVVSGNLALIYQAYKSRYGMWPTWDVAAALIKSGATDSVSSPFLQGAGVVNADRSTDLAAGIYGVYATPSEWQVGDWQGTQYLSFPNMAYAGQTYTQTYTVSNPSGYPITVGLQDGYMKLMSKKELTFTTSDQSLESSFNFHSPDYLLPLDPADIPADAEVMVVRYAQPYSSYDPDYSFTSPANNTWRFLLYNWTDINKDGKLWVDADANGVVNHVGNRKYDNDGFERLDFTKTEIQEGEYVRTDYQFGGVSVPIYVHDPKARMGDGYFFGFQHRRNEGLVAKTTFKVGVEFYKRGDWPWLSLSNTTLTAPAQGQATFTASMALPADAAPGTYEGIIFMQDPGDKNHAAHESALPVVVNVAASLPDNGSLTFGGQAMTDRMFQNSWSNGYFNWYGGGWTGAGDWRKFFFDLDEADQANQNLLVHTSWEDGYPTDYNSFVLGPKLDTYALGYPALFGPYNLGITAQSSPFLSGALYGFGTSTDGPDDWLKAPIQRAGLHQVTLHNVLYAGEELASQYRVDVGTVALSAAGDPAKMVLSTKPFNAQVLDASGMVDFSLTPTLEIPNLYASLAGGLSTNRTNKVTTLADSNSCGSGASCAQTVWVPIQVTISGTSKLTVTLDVPADQDIDLYLANSAGKVLASATGSKGVDDSVTLNNPALGTYKVGLLAYDIPGDTTDTNWFYELTEPAPLPMEEVERLNNNAIAVDQDDPLDPTTASYKYDFTTTERTALLAATLTVPAGSDLDLYLTDADGNILAMSQTKGATETVQLAPAVGEYRLGEGKTYSILVHGFNVAAPVNAQLVVKTKELNVWLTDNNADVITSAIQPGQAATFTLHYAKTGMAVGESFIIRVLGWSDVVPDIFQEFMTITRVATLPTPTWEASDLDVWYELDSPRGMSPGTWWSGVPSVLVSAGERATFTAIVENTGDVDSTELLVDISALPNDYLTTYAAAFGLPPSSLLNQVNGVAFGLVEGPAGVQTGADNISWEGEIAAGESVAIKYWVDMPANMVPVTNFTTGVDVYDAVSSDWYAYALASAYNRNFSTSASTGLPYYSSMDVSQSVVMPGDQFSYIISLGNPSAVDKAIFVESSLPTNVSFVSGSAGVTYDATAHAVTWKGVVPGTTKTTTDIEVVVQVKADAPYGAMLGSNAVASDKYQGATVVSMYAASRIGYPRVTVSASVAQLTTSAGRSLSYTIQVSNVGDMAASNVLMLNEMPQYVNYTANSVMGGAAYENGAVYWEGSLEPGQSMTFTYQASVDAAAPIDAVLVNGAQLYVGNAMTGYASAMSEVIDPTETLYIPVVGK